MNFDDIRIFGGKKIFLVYGNEPYYIDRFMNKVDLEISAKGDLVEKKFFLGKEISILSLLEIFRSKPIFSEERVVLIKEAHSIVDLNKKDRISKLKEYFKKPSCHTTAIFICKLVDKEKPSLLLGLPKDNCEYIYSKKIYDNKISEWTKDYVESKGKKIEPKALAFIQQNIGNNLQDIANKIENILLMHPVLDEIKVEDFYESISIDKRYNVFELQRVICERNLSMGLEIVENIVLNNGSGILQKIISTIFSLVTNLLLVKSRKSINYQDLSDMIGIHPFFVGQYIEGAKQFSSDELLSSINFIYESDLQSKGIRGKVESDVEVCKNLIFQILS